jgi:NAD-dependent dihydropyrimidine dehydrogenase PreA subunit
MPKINIDISYCDGCGKCAPLCPKDVFEIRELTRLEYKQLSFYQKFWVMLKEKTKSFAVNPSACVLCRKCEKECHEKAIKITE